MKCGICGRELQVSEDHRNCVINDYAKTLNDMDDEIKILNAEFAKELQEHEEFTKKISKEFKVYEKALDIMAHDLAILEWEGLGKFARSEEIIKAEVLDAAKDLIGKSLDKI